MPDTLPSTAIGSARVIVMADVADFVATYQAVATVRKPTPRENAAYQRALAILACREILIPAGLQPEETARG